MADLLAGEGPPRRRRLSGGLGLAYGGGRETGLLTISRLATGKPPGDDEVRIVQRDFEDAAAQAGRPVLRFRELSREVVVCGKGRHHVIRFRVYFGEQGRLF